MHLNSELIFEKYALGFFKPSQRILEIGPFGKPSSYQKIVDDNSIQWETLNLENETLIDMMNKDDLTILTSNPYNYPIQDNTYDIVLSGNVMEHVENINLWYKELKRIIKPGGFIITIMPISWPYHEAPVDCWRIYPSGFRALLGEIGLAEVLTKFDSLEFEHHYEGESGNHELLPGKSIYYTKSKALVDSQIKWNHSIKKIPFLRRFKMPFEVAYDIISVSKKTT